MFNQILEPAGQNLGLTILAFLVPLIIFLFLLAVIRMTAWLATIIASVVAILMTMLYGIPSEGEVIRHNMAWTLVMLILIGLLFYWFFPNTIQH